MSHKPMRLIVVAVPLTLLTAVDAAPPKAAAPKAPARFVPKFEAVAETRLLMEGLAQSNHRGLVTLLKKEPADADSWTFARGQALLLAETGNLLLLRPPRSADGQDVWFRQATEMREAATALARVAGNKDYDACKNGLVELTNSCNRCHDSFRVAVRVGMAPRDGAAP